MSSVRVHNFAISLDGFGTGEHQTLDHPFGHADDRLMRWFFDTRMGQQIHGLTGGRRSVEDALSQAWGDGIGVEIMGRNKFGPIRGPWPTEDTWRGWWGEEPPFDTPVFVLTHHPKEPMQVGGTTFHFVEGTPAEVLAMAQEAADGLDVRIGGGPSTVRDFLAADLIDHLHLVLVPIVLGRGVRLWDGLEGMEERFDIEQVSTPVGVTHLLLTRRPR